MIADSIHRVKVDRISTIEIDCLSQMRTASERFVMLLRVLTEIVKTTDVYPQTSFFNRYSLGHASRSWVTLCPNEHDTGFHYWLQFILIFRNLLCWALDTLGYLATAGMSTCSHQPLQSDLTRDNLCHIRALRIVRSCPQTF